MEKVIRQVNLGISAEAAFDYFIHYFNDWWPKEYIWSQGALKEIGIGKAEGGLCTEIGPYGFRCDWGRVTDFVPAETISLKWQIGLDRVPIPDPKNASTVTIDFSKKGDKRTSVELRHVDFKKHGNQGSTYAKKMSSEEGWKYILACYVDYCSQQKVSEQNKSLN